MQYLLNKLFHVTGMPDLKKFHEDLESKEFSTLHDFGKLYIGSPERGSKLVAPHVMVPDSSKEPSNGPAFSGPSKGSNSREADVSPTQAPLVASALPDPRSVLPHYPRPNPPEKSFHEVHFQAAQEMLILWTGPIHPPTMSMQIMRTVVFDATRPMVVS